MTPGDRRSRWLRGFARHHVAALDAAPHVRDSIASLARSIDSGTLPRPDRDENLRLLDELLADELGKGYSTRRNSC